VHPLRHFFFRLEEEEVYPLVITGLQALEKLGPPELLVSDEVGQGQSLDFKFPLVLVLESWKLLRRVLQTVKLFLASFFCRGELWGLANFQERFAGSRGGGGDLVFT